MKTQLQAMVRTYFGTTFNFTGTEASAVVSAVRAHQDIKAKGAPGGTSDEYPIQIPYTSVINVDYWTEQVESTTEDDNCKVQTPAEEVASITLKNISGRDALAETTITLSDTSINGTYSGVTFTNGVATIASGTIAPVASMTIAGLPNGLEVSATVGSGSGTSEPVTGVTPCTLELSNPRT